MAFGVQKLRWYDEQLKAEVLGDNGEGIRSIQYRNANEYNACKQLYFERGGK